VCCIGKLERARFPSFEAGMNKEGDLAQRRKSAKRLHCAAGKILKSNLAACGAAG
jgi:hypothetical protein